jgi:hypothetical protein
LKVGVGLDEANQSLSERFLVTDRALRKKLKHQSMSRRVFNFENVLPEEGEAITIDFLSTTNKG